MRNRLRLHRKLVLVVAPLALLTVGIVAVLVLQRQEGPFDTVICFGRVFDGDKMRPWGTCVAVKDGRVARIGWLELARAHHHLYAWGRVVSPGFIDVHTHVEANISSTRPFRALNFLEQGVTTIITGNCGTSTLHTAALLAGLERNGTQVNVATLVGHNSIRTSVMGSSHQSANSRDIASMMEIVEQNMRDGALGFSTGLAYAPGAFAQRDEVVELAKAAASLGGLYVTHLRDEGVDGKAALEEALDIGRAASMPVHISHFKVASRSQWGQAAERLVMLDKERQAGRHITLDLYGYTASSTSTDILLPVEFRGARVSWKKTLDEASTRRELVGGMVDLLNRNGFPDYGYARIAFFNPSRELNGKTVSEAAELLGDRLPAWDVRIAHSHKVIPPADQIRTVLFLASRGGAQMVYFDMSQPDVETIMRSPFASFGTDSSVRSPELATSHPRGTGNFPRVLGYFVRERNILSLTEALRKMTSLPADTFGLMGRGRIREGDPADLVVFDPETIQARSTYDKPLEPPIGIDLVMVNGGLAIEGDRADKHNFGRALRRMPLLKSR
jgi:N-acyl-D-amino-acid deacylase